MWVIVVQTFSCDRRIVRASDQSAWRQGRPAGRRIPGPYNPQGREHQGAPDRLERRILYRLERLQDRLSGRVDRNRLRMDWAAARGGQCVGAAQAYREMKQISRRDHAPAEEQGTCGHARYEEPN